MSEDGKTVVVEAGNPVWIHADKKETPFDAEHTLGTISRLNGEAKGHRERAEKAELDLKKFEGIEDPAAAKKALETVANLDEGKLLTAGKVDEIKRNAQQAAEDRIKAATTKFQADLDAATETNKKLEGQLYGEMIGGAFSRSKYIGEKLAIPADIAQSSFGKHFKVEDGKVVAYDATGNKLPSRAKPGDFASFEEAIEILVDGYPHKDHILKGTGGGAGSREGSGGGLGAKEITRTAFDRLDPSAKAKTMGDGVKVVDG